MKGHRGHNNLDDATRHAEWSRRMAEEINPLTSTLAGWGHELENIINDKQSLGGTRMDLHNNAEGRRAAAEGGQIDPKSLITNPKNNNNWPY